MYSTQELKHDSQAGMDVDAFFVPPVSAWKSPAGKFCHNARPRLLLTPHTIMSQLHISRADWWHKKKRVPPCRLIKVLESLSTVDAQELQVFGFVAHFIEHNKLTTKPLDVMEVQSNLSTSQHSHAGLTIMHLAPGDTSTSTPCSDFLKRLYAITPISSGTANLSRI